MHASPAGEADDGHHAAGAGVFESLTVRGTLRALCAVQKPFQEAARAATQGSIDSLDLVAETGRRVGSLRGDSDGAS